MPKIIRGSSDFSLSQSALLLTYMLWCLVNQLFAPTQQKPIAVTTSNYILDSMDLFTLELKKGEVSLETSSNCNIRIRRSVCIV